MGIEFAYAAETAFVSPTLLKIGQLLYIGYVFYFVLCRCVSIAHDPDLVPVPPGGVLPHPHPGQPLRQVQVTAWEKKTFHHPAVYWCGLRYGFARFIVSLS